MLARGHPPADIRCRALHDDLVCLRHRRWLGDHRTSLHGRPQVDLTAAPDILRAHRRHQRLIRRDGRLPVMVVFRHADIRCRHWHRHSHNDIHRNSEEFRRLLTLLHGPDWEHAELVDEPAFDAARYPQVVELTSVVLGFAAGREVTYHQPRSLLRSIGRTIAPILGPHENAHFLHSRNPFAALVGEQLTEAFPWA